MTLRPIGKTDEDIEDVVAALLAAGNALDVTYDDENGTLTVDVSENAIGTGELSFDTATQDELDAVESSAADARTDLRFALYPEEIDASTRDTYYQNFEKFANSAAMTSIAASAVVMDEVSVSDTALDAIWESQTAWDIVKAKSMAVGKFAAGRAGLDGANYTDIDAVSTSQTAMDAVSVSALAMEAIAASQIAMDAVVAATDVGLPTVVETETAMNEVSLSDLALDTLWASTDAWDLIKANAMAVGKFAAGRAGLSGYDYADIDAVATSQTAMDAVSTSATAMDAVSTSATAMDAVSSSDLAMDAIWDSQDVAWAAVRDLAMAVGKFVAGRAGLEPQDYADIDAVAADQAAMDAVSTSQTAMDAVSASIVARTTALLSSVATDAIWSSELAADAMWNIATPALPWTDSNWDAYLISRSNVGNLPQTWADGNTSTPPPDDTRSEKAFVMDNIGSSDGTDHGISFTLDFNEISTLNVYTYMYVKTWGPDNSTMHIKVDGSKLWESADGTNGGDHSWTQRSLDVSGLNGELEVELGAQDNNSDTWVALFDEVTAQ